MSPFKLSLLTLLAASSCFAGDDVSLKTNPQTHATTVKAKTYAATVEADGYLTSFLVGGKEFFLSKEAIPRGAYLYQHGAVPLTEISTPDATTLLAKGEAGSLKYEFGPHSVKVTVMCAKGADMHLYIALSSNVTAVTDATGSAFKTPARLDDQKLTWFADKHRLAMEFADGNAGAFAWSDDKIQIVNVVLSDGDTKLLTLDAGDADARQTAAVAKAKPQP